MFTGKLVFVTKNDVKRDFYFTFYGYFLTIFLVNEISIDFLDFVFSNTFGNS